MKRRVPWQASTAFAFVVAFGVAGAAGCPSEVAAPGCKGAGCKKDEGPAEPPRLFVDPPFGLGYDCVTIGCDVERTLVIENRGGGVVRIPLVRLSVDTSTDFSIRRADDVPLPLDDQSALALAAGEAVELKVRYAPSDGVRDEGTVLIDWYDGAVDFADAVLTHVELPLSTRALGGVAANVLDQRLNFGFVPVGGYTVREIVVKNDGEGGVLEVGPVTLAEGTPETFLPPTPDAWATRFINPGEETRIPVSFRPDVEGVFTGALFVPTNDGANPALRVDVAGTSVSEPRARVSPSSIDFVTLPLGSTRTVNVLVTNVGGAPLSVTATAVFGPGLQVFPAEPQILPVLESAAFAAVWTPPAGGPFSGQVALDTNDPTQPRITVDAVGFADAPLLSASPAAVDFGGVVLGWTTGAQTIHLSNTGFGDLTINTIAFEVGSSSQIVLADVPALPIKLSPGEAPLAINVFLQASALGTQNAVLLVGSDSVDGPLGSGGVARINVTGRVISCEEGCPVANGEPSCATGACTIASCDSRFHDANDGFADGCECGEDLVPGGGGARRDIDGFCGGLDMGTLHDNSSPRSATFSGTLHDETDVDLFFFRARDDFQFPSDDYGARVSLESGPPGLRVFARFVAAGGGCGGETQRSTNLSGGGNGIGDDSQDVTVWVEWAPGVAPQCGTYTIRVRADGG